MSTRPDSHDNERVLLAPASLRDMLLDEDLVQELSSIGLERTSDLWVLALGERISPRPEFSTLLRRVLRCLVEQQNPEEDAQYETTLSFLSEEPIESKDSPIRVTMSEHLLDDAVVRVSLLMRVSEKSTIYWEAWLPNSCVSQETLLGSLDNAECRAFCAYLLDKARSDIRVTNWTEPPTHSWQDLPKPSSDLFVRWLKSAKNSERDLRVFQQRIGLLSGHRKTLEEVGQELEITRERVRQVVHRYLSHLCHPVRRKRLIPFSVRLRRLFQEYGGIMTLKEVADRTSFAANAGEFSPLPAVELILYCCGGFRALDYDYESGRGSSDISGVTWHMETVSPESMKANRKLAYALIDRDPCKYDFNELVRLVCTESGGDIEITRASLRTYPLIEPDPSGLMVRTGKYLTITAMALIVLREIGVPAHFTFITEKINDRFPGRDLKPNHVHNHLMNPLFRWVDRGTYGLAELGLPDIKPKENYSAEKKAVRLALQAMGSPATIREIEEYLNKVTTEDVGLTFLSKPSIILYSNPQIFVSLGQGKWGLVEWNLAPSSMKDTTSLACDVLAEDVGAWLTIQEIHMEMRSRGWTGSISSLQRALDRELGKLHKRVRREELHGFNILLYGLADRDWNEQTALARLLAD